MSSTFRPRIVSLCTDHRIDRRILDAAQRFVQHGWSTTVIAPPAPNDDLADECSYPEVGIFRLAGAFVPPGIAALNDARFLEFERLFPWQRRLAHAALAMAPEVIVANDLPQLPAALIAAAPHNSTVVYDAHELYPQQASVSARRVELEQAERALVQHCDGIVTVNDSIADMMALLYRCPRPDVVLNCPRVAQYGDAVNDAGLLRAATGLPASTRILLYQGAMSAHRNLMEMVEGMALVQRSDVALVLMGGRSALGDQLEARARELALLGSRVFLVPEQPASDLLRWTAGADAGIIPYPPVDLNTVLCTPNKLFEFLSAGLPILASHGTELRRLIGDQGVGLNAAMNTPAEFARAIDAFFSLDLPTLRERVRVVAPRYAFEVEGERWPAIIERACAERAARPARSTTGAVRVAA